ncbi:MAG: SH3 domain-containing protein [Caldilineaceae bacterium]
MKRWIGCWVLLLSLLLSGCWSSPEATPTPTKTPPSQSGSDASNVQPAAIETPTASVGQTPNNAAPPSTAATDQSSTPAVAADGGAEIAVISTDLLNVRSGPSTTDEIVRTANQGEQFNIIGRSQDGDWVQIAQGETPVGWVSAEFVTVQQAIQGDAPTASGPTPTSQASSPSTNAPALSSSMLSPDYGAQAFLWWKEEVADRDLKLMEDGGFNWVKQTFAWETIETNGKGQFDWARADRVVQHVRDHNLKLLARLSSDPELTTFWAGKPPQNVDNFADFAFALASRYNCSPQAVGCIQAYQIWNEPNLAREWGNNRPNPGQYVDMLRKTYAAIKRGNPNAIVVSAGMAPTGDNSNIAMPDDLFYEEMYKAMGNSSGYFDMLGVHGAGFAAPPELDPAEAAANQQYGGYRFFAFRHVEDIRAIMVRYGDTNKKVVLLEFGWTFDSVNPAYKWHGADAGITEMVQADYLKRAYVYAAENWQPWIGLMSLLTMPNIDWLADGNPEDEEQYWWAIMRPGYPDLHWRAAYIVLCDYFNRQRGQFCPYDPARQ